MNLPSRCGLTAVSFALALLAAVAAPVERSVSTSRQFIAYGADVRLRGAVCDLAERTKESVLRLLDRRDEWATPILLHIEYPQANLPELPRAAFHLSQTGSGLKIQLDLIIGLDVQRVEIQRELLRAILLEMVYRRSPNLVAGTAYISPPEWLLEGIRTRESDFDSTALLALLQTPLAARKILPREQFLQQRPELLDAPARSLYTAYSHTLLDLRLHLPDGCRRLGLFIDDLPIATNDLLAELQRHFPEMADAGKKWTLFISQFSAGQPFELLAAAETNRRLEALLQVKIRAASSEKIYRLEEFPQFLRAPSAKIGLAELRRDFLALTTRANPIYRPIIGQYGQITELLLRGKTRRLRERLARLGKLRENIAGRMREIDDYMNWFEATKSRGPSGAFADYFKAAEGAAQPAERRHDLISVYLDTLEAQFQN